MPQEYITHQDDIPRGNALKYIIAGVVLIVLCVTNPTLVDHRFAVTSKINELLRKEAVKDESTQSTIGAAGTELGLMFASAVINKFADVTIERKNFYLFSLTSFEFNGNEKIIGLGILGKVFISDEVDEKFKDVKNGLK
jgi:Domain of unknown function (DUF4359)